MQYLYFFITLFGFFISPMFCSAQAPIFTDFFTADPSARVFKDTLYVYPSHDRDSARWWDMEDYYVYRTTDLKHWENAGKILSLSDIDWAEKYAWAPDCIEKDGQYYFYFPTDQKHIGVAVADHPTGPFKDALQRPLLSISDPGVICDRDFIDPCPFIDKDGQAYLFVGQNTLNILELNPDMVSHEGKIHIIDNLPDFFEAVWMHERQGIYYLSYSGHGKIYYATADHPTGPFTFKGPILGEVNSGTNHHSIVEFKGNWYMFYHTSDLALSKIPADDPEQQYVQWRRSVCMQQIKYLDNGDIQPINHMTPKF
ncbi:family 43 glycosylhydrolase [Persicobacter diffluens]|uniref:Alpha-N-arabinofuranosidase n=1 Tax=Persicobacter diffluens TaxID=981 RepID=A0AAN5ALW3_9BACT|nr:hypothetical protein PEDI_49570 [Persicobacter diffluens]